MPELWTEQVEYVNNSRGCPMQFGKSSIVWAGQGVSRQVNQLGRLGTAQR